MTQKFYLNIIRSLRAFFYNIDSSVRWYIDTENENMLDDEFVEVLTSTRIIEDEIKPSFGDLINLNVYSKNDIDVLVGKIYEALDNRFIDILNYVDGTLEKVGSIYVKRIDITNLGSISGYYVKNLSIVIECYY